MAPAKIVQTRGGWPFFEVDVTAAKANPADRRDAGSCTGAAAGRGGPPAAAAPAAAPPALTVTTEKLGDGLYRLTTGAGSYDSLIVEFKDHIMMLEAGQSRGARARLHRGNEEAVPEQADPLRHEHASALRSHRRAAGARGRRRHDHHAEEQRGVLRAGAQHAAHAARTTRSRRIRRRPRSKPWRRRRSTRTAREPSRCTTSIPAPHSNGLMVAYIPKEKVLFQGDFSLPAAGAAGQRSRQGAGAGAREAQPRLRSLHQRARVRGAADQGGALEGRREIEPSQRANGGGRGRRWSRHEVEGTVVSPMNCVARPPRNCCCP